MNNQNSGQGKVLIICETESFLANSLMSKLEGNSLKTVLSHGEIKEIDKERGNIELIILFMNEDMEEMTDTLVYLKDLASDCDIKMILIGDEEEHKQACKVIPEIVVLDRFKRPLIMDDLIKTILKYMKENTGENRKKTVLIVDDDITYVRTVYEWLKDKYKVAMANSGLQAIKWLGKNKADLILLDYEMPITNGPQVLEMLRADSDTSSIPVIFLTGRGDKESVMAVVSLKPEGYFLKNIEKPELLEKLQTFFARKK